jgi:hypothetical protein
MPVPIDAVIKLALAGALAVPLLILSEYESNSLMALTYIASGMVLFVAGLFILKYPYLQPTVFRMEKEIRQAVLALVKRR